MTGSPPPALRPLTTREAALAVLVDLIRRNAAVEIHYLRILAELAELPARTRAASAERAALGRPASRIGGTS